MNLTLAASSQAAIILERRRPVASSAALSVTGSAGAVELFLVAGAMEREDGLEQRQWLPLASTQDLSITGLERSSRICKFGHTDCKRPTPPLPRATLTTIVQIDRLAENA